MTKQEPSTRAAARTVPAASLDGPSQTLAKGLKILNFLATSDTGKRATEVARTFGYNLNTAGRLLATLEASGFASRDPSGIYTIGAKVVAAAVTKLNVANLTNIARAHLMALRDATSETAILVARVGTSLVVIDAIESKHSLRVVIKPGAVTPLFPATTAFTTTIDLPPREVVALSRKSGNPKRTVSESDVITARAELAKQGYLVRHAALRSDGTCTAAAPIRSRGVTVASIGVAGPSQRWDETTVKPFAKLFRHVTSELSAQLSGL